MLALPQPRRLESVLHGREDNRDAAGLFVAQAARELLSTIDPSAVPPAPSKGKLTAEQIKALGAQGGDKKNVALSKEKLDELLRQLKQQMPQPGPSGAPAGKP